MKLAADVVRARLATPFVTSAGTHDARELILVTLTDDDGAVGYGEAAPLLAYDGVTIAECLAALDDCRPVLGAGGTHSQLLVECSRVAACAPAVAAIDLALWDLAGRRTGTPVWQLLGSDAVDPVEVNATIASADRASASAAALAARNAGFRCLKVKVGLGDDGGRVAAVRAAAGPEMAIRIDANGAWSVDEAVAFLRVVEPVGIELCEEPVAGLDAIASVARATPVPIALDESATLPSAFDQRACDSVCLKVAGSGGITGTVDAVARARAVGYRVYLASTLDGPLGIAAALHVAAVIKPERPSGLATLAMFERHVPGGGLAPANGQMTPPTAPGLITDDMIRWYAGVVVKKC